MTATAITVIAIAAVLVAALIVALWRTIRSGGGPAGPTGSTGNGPRHVESDWASSGSLPSRPYRTVPRLP